jgi:hypothetical protein
MLVNAITDCQAAGVVRSGEAQELVLVAWSTVHGVSALLVDGQLAGVSGKPIREIAEVVTRGLFLGLGLRQE